MGIISLTDIHWVTLMDEPLLKPDGVFKLTVSDVQGLGCSLFVN